jgi:fructan beta-fructosidase
LGHAVSRDLLYWEQLPVALRPDELGFIFSGSAVVDGNDTSGFFDGGEGLVAIYTNAGGKDYTEQEQSIACSKDRGRTWTKYKNNPIIPSPSITDFRDPKVFWHGPTSRWLMVLAAGDRVMFYNSLNLKNWTKLSEFGMGEGTHGGVWEYPELFELPVGDTGRRRWVLQVGVDPGGFYGGSGAQHFVGDFDGERFVSENPPETVLWVDRGKDFYATQNWTNVPAGRRLWIAWMNNWQYAPTRSRLTRGAVL